MTTSTPSSPKQRKREDRDRRKFLPILLLPLISFLCIFCASQSALWFIDRDQIAARTTSLKQADYSPGPLIVVPPVDPKIIEEAEADREAIFGDDNEIILGGLVPVPLPPRPTPTPIQVAFVTPTPTLIPTPESEPTSAPTLPPPTPIPPPTVPPTAQPTNPPPTDPPPTVAPTDLPPTVAPTDPPSTVAPTDPPPTVAPTDPPPTVAPTDPPPTVAPTDPPPTATPVPPVVQFSAATYSVNESDGIVAITVQLDQPLNQTITVNYATSNGTATSGVDYTSVVGVLTFSPGETSKTFNVPITNDSLDETDETVSLTLSNAVNATLGGINPAILTIFDSTPAPSIQFSSATYSILENGANAIITATLSTPSALTVTVNYGTSDGTAVAGSDYTNTSGTLIFPPGFTVQTFSVPIIDNTTDESDETVNLSLLPAINNAVFGTPSTAILTILDNDPRPTIQFSQPSYTILEDGGTLVITATLSQPSDLTVTANYNIIDTTTTAGVDYALPTTGILTFLPGAVEATFTISILDDGINELDETALLQLSSPINADLGTPSVADFIIEDDDRSAVQFDRLDYTTAEGIATTIITTTLTPSAPTTVTVEYAATNLTATAGDDYTVSGNTLTFAPGQTTLTFTITISDDAFMEPSETALLNLNNPNPPSDAMLGATAPATLTIADNGDVSTCNNEGLSSTPGEPNIGPPDGFLREVFCNSAFIVDLGATPINTSGDAAFDFAYYEQGQPDPPTSTTSILLDWVVIEVASDLSGPWYQVFYWGDAITDTNTSLGQAGVGPNTSAPLGQETDNENVGIANLYGTLPYKTGIAIDVDAVAPSGTYRYVRFYVPPGGGNDVMQVDAIEILP